MRGNTFLSVYFCRSGLPSRRQLLHNEMHRRTSMCADQFVAGKAFRPQETLIIRGKKVRESREEDKEGKKEYREAVDSLVGELTASTFKFLLKGTCFNRNLRVCAGIPTVSAQYVRERIVRRLIL